jgi:ribosomal protein S27AE
MGERKVELCGKAFSTHIGAQYCILNPNHDGACSNDIEPTATPRRITFRTEDTMEKFGVEEGANQEELEKQAMQGCPKCGGRVARHGATLTCNNCGTEPFETEKK